MREYSTALEIWLDKEWLFLNLIGEEFSIDGLFLRCLLLTEGSFLWFIGIDYIIARVLKRILFFEAHLKIVNYSINIFGTLVKNPQAFNANIMLITFCSIKYKNTSGMHMLYYKERQLSDFYQSPCRNLPQTIILQIFGGSGWGGRITKNKKNTSYILYIITSSIFSALKRIDRASFYYPSLSLEAAISFISIIFSKYLSIYR